MTIDAAPDAALARLAAPGPHLGIGSTGWVRERLDLAVLTEAGQIRFPGSTWRYHLESKRDTHAGATLADEWSGASQDHPDDSLRHLAALAPQGSAR